MKKFSEEYYGFCVGVDVLYGSCFQGALNDEMKNVIRDNTRRIEKQLELLQQEDIDLRTYRG